MFYKNQCNHYHADQVLLFHFLECSMIPTLLHYQIFHRHEKYMTHVAPGLSLDVMTPLRSTQYWILNHCCLCCLCGNTEACIPGLHYNLLLTHYLNTSTVNIIILYSHYIHSFIYYYYYCYHCYYYHYYIHLIIIKTLHSWNFIMIIK